MSRNNEPSRTPIPGHDSLEQRRTFDEAQLEPAMNAASLAALEMVRLIAASRGSHPPDPARMIPVVRAAMSAAGAYWQALVRAAE